MSVAFQVYAPYLFAALVAIVRGNRVITPSPEEPLEPSDELLFVALTTKRSPALKPHLSFSDWGIGLLIKWVAFSFRIKASTNSSYT